MPMNDLKTSDKKIGRIGTPIVLTFFAGMLIYAFYKGYQMINPLHAKTSILLLFLFAATFRCFGQQALKPVKSRRGKRSWTVSGNPKCVQPGTASPWA